MPKYPPRGPEDLPHRSDPEPQRSSDYDTAGFGIGVATGIPTGSIESFVGAEIHSMMDTMPSPSTDSFSGGGGDFGGAGASGSFDT